MKKRILSVLLCAAMVASLLVGCGSKDDAVKDTPVEDEANTPADDAADAEAGTVKVAAVETAYGADMWQAVAEGFEAATGIKVQLTVDRNLHQRKQLSGINRRYGSDSSGRKHNSWC